jgi:predicted anti-sigma-YlaC factor YlaD
MNCYQVKRKLSAYLDRELDSALLLELENHLERCESCRQEFEILKTTWDLLAHEPSPELHPFFYTRLKARQKAQKAHARAPWIERILIPISVTAVVALGIFLGSSYRNGTLNGRTNGTDPDELYSYLENFQDFPETSFRDMYNLVDIKE